MEGTEAVDVRLLTEADAGAFFTLRLQGLERYPLAFGMPAETWRAFSPEAVVERVRPSPKGNFTLGAFAGGALVGAAGFVRLSGKERHKGFVWGVYVTDSARGRGVGRALLEALVAQTKTYPGLEQLTLTVANGAGGGAAALRRFRVQGVWARATRAQAAGPQRRRGA